MDAGKRQQYIATLSRYVPEGTAPMVVEWITLYRFRLRITKSRSSRLGDYTPPYQGQPHVISVNHDLNPYAFFVTLTHEIAHLVVWTKYKDSVLPHGAEWKEEFSLLLADLLGQGIFPGDVELALLDYIRSPKAASCTDKNLYKTLRKYDVNPDLLLEDIPEGTVFSIRNGMIFRKGIRKRTRYLCQNMENKRMYYVSAVAEIQVVNPALPFDGQ